MPAVNPGPRCPPYPPCSELVLGLYLLFYLLTLHLISLPLQVTLCHFLKPTAIYSLMRDRQAASPHDHVHTLSSGFPLTSLPPALLDKGKSSVPSDNH